jgi:glycine betaine/choline ABC-type transport system substrate-binding protein
MKINRRDFIFDLAVGGTTLALSAGCRSGSRLTVGCKNFPEQLILGEILAQSIEDTLHQQVDRRFYLAGTYICQQAILAGRIDIYVEYTGTALAAVLKERATGDRNAVFETVRDEYRRRFNLELLPSLGFSNSFAIVMRPEDAQSFGIRSLSELAKFAPQLRIGVGYEFLDRPDGFKGLVERYGLKFMDAPQVMDLALLYRALMSRQVDIIVGSNTDGLIEALHLVVLEDDRQYFPPYDAVPVARTETLQRFPTVEQVFLSLAGSISAEKMRKMNYAVDGLKQDAAQVAAAFVRTQSVRT